MPRISPFTLVQIAAVALFIGRGAEHLLWDAPFRALLWDEAWMQSIVTVVLGIPWEEYITSEQVDRRIQAMIRIQGGFYLICALIALFIRQLPRPIAKVLYLGSFCLIVLAFLFFKEKFYSLGQFLEYALQFSTPWFLYQLRWNAPANERLLWWMKMATAVTFTCHGLYAVGYYPQPGHFTEMVINILGVGEDTALWLLKVMGILDFIISILIFFSFRWAKPALIYAVFWGFVTSFARVWSSWDLEFLGESLLQSWHDTVMRFPHFLVPLALLILLQNRVIRTSS